MKYWYWEENPESGRLLPLRNYVEIDEEGYEVRKVNFYRDGEVEIADETHETRRTGLGERPLPELEVLSEIIQGPVIEINKEKFEQVWLTYSTSQSSSDSSGMVDTSEHSNGSKKRYWYWERLEKGSFLPLRTYVEIDHEGYEIRKVNFFENQEVEFADETNEAGRTGLGDRPLPVQEVLSEMIKFPVFEISKEQFEYVWTTYAKQK